MEKIKKFYKGFCWVEETVCCIGFAAMIILVFTSAIARGIGSPLAWSIDIAQLLLCWTTLIGADVSFRHGKFMGLDLVTRKFPIKFQRILEIVMDILILCALVIFIIYGTDLSIDSWKRTFQTLTISYSFITMALPVMSAVMCISVIIDIVNKVKNIDAPVAVEVQE